MAKQEKDDFNPQSLIKNLADHARDVLDLKEKVKDFESRFGTHEKIAETLSDTSKTAIKMQEMLCDTFVKLLDTNDAIKNKISEIINKTDRNNFYVWAKSIGLGAWTIIVAVISAIAGAVARSHF